MGKETRVERLEESLFEFVFWPFEAAQGKAPMVRVAAMVFGTPVVIAQMVLAFPVLFVLIVIEMFQDMGDKN